MTDEAILAVEAAAALNPTRGFVEEHSAAALQFAVARAVFEGSPSREIAAAAHMTPLEVLDASDALAYGLYTSWCLIQVYEPRSPHALWQGLKPHRIRPGANDLVMKDVRRRTTFCSARRTFSDESFSAGL